MMPPVSARSRLYFACQIAIGGELAGERVVEERRGVRAGDADLGHVREVEEAGGGAHRVVLGEIAGVAHRHLPAGEVGEAGAGIHVNVVQRRELWRWFGGCRARVLLAVGRKQNSPSVMSLRASPTVVDFHRGRNRQQSGSSPRDFDRLNPNRFAIRFSEWPIRCGTEDLRDWRGGLLLRCSPAWANSPASCCGPIFDCASA